LLAALTAACAPDALNNRSAPEFNAFLNRIAAACRPLLLGSQDMGYAIEHGAALGNDNYSYFLDMTSRLYYGRIDADAYRSGITGFLGPGADTLRSLDCILGNLDANRPLPPGAPPPLKM
jgi:hypothetical protein